MQVAITNLRKVIFPFIFMTIPFLVYFTFMSNSISPLVHLAALLIPLSVMALSKRYPTCCVKLGGPLMAMGVCVLFAYQTTVGFKTLREKSDEPVHFPQTPEI